MATFHGTNGNDKFTGTAGNDTFTLAGNAAGYQIQMSVRGRVQVRDIDFSDGNTGTDTIFGIEALSFADQTFTLSETVEVNVSSGYGYDVSPSIVVLTNGSYVVNYQWQTYAFSEDGDYFVSHERYDAAGNPQGGGTLSYDHPNDTGYASATALADGGYLIVQDAEDFGLEPGAFNYGIFAQRYDAAGNRVGGVAHINTTELGHQYSPVAAALDGGGFVVAWESEGQDGANYGVYSQRFNAAGNKVGAETLVNSTTAGSQGGQVIATLADGDYLIAWESDGQDGSDLGIYAQRFDVTGSKVGGETRVNTTTALAQSKPAISALSDGGFLIAWQSNGQDGSGLGIYAQRFDAAGNAVGGEVQVNTSTTGNQFEPSITELVNGDYLIGWIDAGNYFVQRFDAAGNAEGDQVLIGETVSWAGDEGAPIAALADGGFLVARVEYADRFNESSRVVTTRYTADGQLMVQTMELDGTGGDDIMNGGIGSQTLRGLTGHDVLNGGSSRDTLYGGRGKDTLAGDQGHDTLNGGLGNDALIGGTGNDAFVFDTAIPDSINVDTISDFTHADVIRLDNAIFAKLGTATGALNANYFRANADGVALDADDYILYENDTGNLYYDTDGSGAAGGRILFAVIGTGAHPALTVADFAVI